MKHAAALSALFAVVLAAQPKFLNSNFDVQEGQSFTLKFDQCTSGCTITIQDGPVGGKKNVKTLTSSATGGSFTFTPSDLPSGEYSFYIQDNSNKDENNYSAPFQYKGTGSASSAASSGATTGASTGSASETSASATGSSTESTAMTTASSSASSQTSSGASSAASTSEASSTSASSSSATSSAAGSSTTVPNAGAQATPMALIVGAAAALAFL